jgi:hypothetical protein
MKLFIQKKIEFFLDPIMKKIKKVKEEINKSMRFDLNSRYFLSFLEKSYLLFIFYRKNSNLLKKMKLQNFFVLFGNTNFVF